MDKWRENLTDYKDKKLCDYLEFGWITNYSPTQYSILIPTVKNHQSALDYPNEINTYISQELSHCALIGPFTTTPLDQPCQTSPLMTRPKRNSSSRRVITDCSFPLGASVNDGIPRDRYDGEPIKLTLPTVDDICTLIKGLGKHCYLYSHDLERAYRQLRSDPGDYPLLGINWGDQMYIDIAIPFGLPWGAMAMQRTTEAVCYIHKKHGHLSRCYIDDFIGLAPDLQAAVSGYQSMQATLRELGLNEARHKGSPPTQTLTWIGVLFDTNNMEIRVTPSRVREILDNTLHWSHRHAATRQQLQQLLGHLFYICQCVKPARLFLSRMLITLRASPKQGWVHLDNDFKLDIHWFQRFLPQYNGVHLIDPPASTHHMEADACLTGCGGIYNGEYYHTQFPPHVMARNRPICHLEILNLVIAVKLWAPQWQHSVITVYCDNMTAVSILSHGRGKDPFILQCAREIWLLSALHSFTVIPTHRPGCEMTISDALSRHHLHKSFRDIVSSLNNAQSIMIPTDLFNLTSTI